MLLGEFPRVHTLLCLGADGYLFCSKCRNVVDIAKPSLILTEHLNTHAQHSAITVSTRIL